jgi:hypothetical protein
LSLGYHAFPARLTCEPIDTDDLDITLSIKATGGMIRGRIAAIGMPASGRKLPSDASNGGHPDGQ